jgi:hypothetical protein
MIIRACSSGGQILEADLNCSELGPRSASSQERPLKVDGTDVTDTSKRFKVASARVSGRMRFATSD